MIKICAGAALSLIAAFVLFEMSRASYDALCAGLDEAACVSSARSAQALAYMGESPQVVAQVMADDKAAAQYVGKTLTQ